MSTPAAGAAPAALVVVNFGSHDLLRRNLAWAFAGRASEGDGVDGPVIVVDNHRSDADSAAMAQLASEAGWELVPCAGNVGFGVGVNRGAERAWALGADVVVLVNPDLEITASQVTRLRDAARRDRSALVSPAIVGADGRAWGRVGGVDVRGGRLTTTHDGAGPGWLSGACLAVHRERWETLAGMDVDYFMYWEDVDLSVRCERAGGHLTLLEDVVVTHDHGGTAPTDAGKSAGYYYYNCRNRLVFAAKRLPVREMLRWIVLTPADVRRVVNRGRPLTRTAKVHRALPPALRGCLAGLWWMLRHSPSAIGAQR